MNSRTLVILLIGFQCFVSVAAADDSRPQPSVVTIEKTDGGFELRRNGQPYFINGAGGSAYLDRLVQAGGNSIRTWGSSRRTLDEAGDKGLTVCMGLWLQLPRQGADYLDAAMLAEQRRRIGEEVRDLKDHPALLLWGIGNEVEHAADPDAALRVWQEIEVLAQLIKHIDPHHPVITVIAGAGSKLADIQRLCPSLDAVGINSYGGLGAVPAELDKYGWDKPYLVTEFGPRGWWEAPTTAWGLPIEQSSTEKAQFYYDAYMAAVAGRPTCLGAYVFLWGNKQEKTHTWFNLFLPDGTPTEIVDTMSRLWTGQWPDNRAPKIGDRQIYVAEKEPDYIYPAGRTVHFGVQASDPDGDALTVRWDLRPDGADNPSIGGDREPRIPPIEGAVVSSEAKRAVIRMPETPGNYRVFVYVLDPSGKAATANRPIQVK